MVGWQQLPKDVPIVQITPATVFKEDSLYTYIYIYTSQRCSVELILLGKLLLKGCLYYVDNFCRGFNLEICFASGISFDNLWEKKLPVEVITKYYFFFFYKILHIVYSISLDR